MTVLPCRRPPEGVVMAGWTDALIDCSMCSRCAASPGPRGQSVWLVTTSTSSTHTFPHAGICISFFSELLYRNTAAETSNIKGKRKIAEHSVQPSPVRAPTPFTGDSVGGGAASQYKERGHRALQTSDTEWIVWTIGGCIFWAQPTSGKGGCGNGGFERDGFMPGWGDSSPPIPLASFCHEFGFNQTISKTTRVGQCVGRLNW